MPAGASTKNGALSSKPLCRPQPDTAGQRLTASPAACGISLHTLEVSQPCPLSGGPRCDRSTSLPDEALEDVPQSLYHLSAPQGGDAIRCPAPSQGKPGGELCTNQAPAHLTDTAPPSGLFKHCGNHTWARAQFHIPDSKKV